MKLMKWLVIILTLSMASAAFASTCEVSYKSGKLSWTAFKTPKKVGVGATFEDFSIKSEAAKSVEELLDGASFKVNVASVNSGDKARDAKIVGFFFKTAGRLIPMSGKVLSAKDGTVNVEFDINGKKKTIPMAYSMNEDSKELTVKGKIDVLEFALKKNLAAITKACYEKHEGVTWPDVEIQIVASLNNTCK